jgi:MFS family permease
MEPALVQRRTLRVLFATQIISGIGVAIGASVGALLAAEIAGIGASGLAQSATVVGAALLAVPATAIVHRHGRRPSLAALYGLATVGAIVLVAAAMRGSIPGLFAGFFLFGGATAAGLQARYAALDLAPSALRGRQLSIIVWGTTLGAVVGPSLAAPAGASLDGYGVPTLAGPFFFSALLFGLATIILTLALRPDPALVARGDAGRANGRRAEAGTTGMRAALRAVLGQPAARLGVSAMAVGHVVMIGVMTMTPVHIRGAGHDPAHTLRIVGLVLSSHIAGMFAFSPVFGWLTDRLGRRRPPPRETRRGADDAGPRLVGRDGGGVHAAQRVGGGGPAGIGAGPVGPHDGTGRSLGRRALRPGGRGLGLPDAHPPRRSRDRAVDRAGVAASRSSHINAS